RHCVGHLAGVSLHIIQCEGLATGHRSQAPWPPPFRSRFGTMQRITFADDADTFSLVVQYWNAADVIFWERLSHALDRCLRASGDYRGCHDVTSFHWAPPGSSRI